MYHCERARVPDLFMRPSAFQVVHCKQLLSRPVQHGYKLRKLCRAIEEPRLTDEPRSAFTVVQGLLTQKR